jgi:hypothetical protein
MTITATELKLMDVAYLGQPFVYISTSDIDTYELDTAYLGQPFVAAPEPEPEPEPVSTVTPSGGFTYPLDDRHKYSHISKTVRKIIKKVAKEQVEEQIENEGAVESQEVINQAMAARLMTALAKADLKYQAFYAEILEIERQRLIDEEIKQLMAIKRMRDEEEEVLAVLMAIP